MCSLVDFLDLVVQAPRADPRRGVSSRLLLCLLLCLQALTQ